MRIRYDNIWAYPLGTTEEEAWLSAYLCLPLPNGDVECLLGDFEGERRFLAGLVPRVRKAALAEGFYVEVVDERAPALGPRLSPNLSWLRDYQLEATRKLVEAERGIVWAPGGSGKGEIAVALGMSVDLVWLFLVHRSTLVHDVAERWQRHTGTEAGIVASGAWNVPDGARFVCATFSAMRSGFQRRDLRAEDLVERVGGVLVDECHTTPCRTHLSVLERLDRARYRIGLSGTPLDRGDRRSTITIGALGPVKYKIKAALLVERGDVSKCTVHFVSNHAATLPSDLGWQIIYRQCVSRSKKRNALLARVAVAAKKPAILFVQRDEHAEKLEKRLLEGGMKVARVWGDTTLTDRREAARRLAAGDLELVIASTVWQEGLDLPGLASVINGGSGKSTIATIQKSWRGSRTTDEKSAYDVWDIYDTGNWLLSRWAKARREAYEREAHDIVFVRGEGL